MTNVLSDIVSGAHDNPAKLICYATQREIMLIQSIRIIVEPKEMKELYTRHFIHISSPSAASEVFTLRL